ncbi:MAG TPA: hypothetical protein PLR25_23105 [Planctomycetaceae bacterium]|nr:hypothetical protein [Planctomycetaceae bacterium]
MRKSLGPPPKQGRDLFSDLQDEEDAPPESETIDELAQDDDDDI